MCLCHQLGLKTPASWRNGTSFFEKPPTFLPLSGGLTDFFTSSNRYSGRLRSYIGRICTPFAYLAGLYVLLAPSKSAIFVDLGPKMAKYGRWRPDTGVTHQLIAVLCSLVTMAAMYGHWLTHLRRICDIPSRRLLSAVLYGETPLGADRAEEVRLTDKRKSRGGAPDPARPGGPKGKGQFGIVKKCRVPNGMWGFS